MRLLALNCGSSSLKSALFEVAGADDLTRLATATVRGLPDDATLDASVGDVEERRSLGACGASQAAEAVLGWYRDRDLLSAVEGVAHRVVHGGRYFEAAVRLDDAARDAIEAATRLAPLHNRPALDVLRVAMEAVPDRPHVAAFDTAFHSTMPAHAKSYALPRDLAERHSLYRFGFHGLAHRDMAERSAALLGRPLAETRLVTLQLGSGCSAAAIEGGRSVDTSMGMTPLEGMVMATRSGDVDPALPLLLVEGEGWPPSEVEALLNERSGLLGASGLSGDVRELLQAEARGHEGATLALAMYCYRARKQVGAYLAALGGADAIVFGGAVGEHQPEVRRRVCAGLEWAGVRLDDEANGRASGTAVISLRDAPVAVHVVVVDEERMLAREAFEALTPSGGP
ncbi:MAG: acetate/propionate family kinase [Dehalococcoidia bacterium]|nr:acetate/propionate family kinase [Dehalococcoidia bacterium]